MTACLRALIFDVDGTLAETERDGHRVAFNRAFADAGLCWHWSPECYGKLLAVTGGKERIAHYWRTVDAAGAASAAAPLQVLDLHRRKTAHFLALLRDGAVRPRPGVRRLLCEARARGLTLAIATTTSDVNVRRLLEVCIGPEAPGWFGVVGAGDVVPRKKPAPDIYRWVLERLRLHADECIAVEDSGPGAAAAIAAGLATVVTRGSYSRRDDIAGVLCDLDGLGEPGRPARGTAPAGQPGRRWCGMVDVDALRAWHGHVIPAR